MAYKKEDVEAFETDWRIVKRHLNAMMKSPILTEDMYSNFYYRIQYLEQIVIEISDVARSDKD